MAPAFAARHPQPVGSPTAPSSPEPRLFGVLFWGLLLVLLWAPLPLGSNRPWAAALLFLCLWALLGSLLLAAAWHPGAAQLLLQRLRRAWLPLALLAGFALLVVAQLLPWWPAPLREAWLPLALAPDLPASAGPLTLDVAATRRYLLATLSYAAAFVLVLALAHTRQRVLWLLGALLASGVLQALLAVVLYSADGHYQFFFYEFRQGQRAMGTFPNPDHLAGYMVLCLAAGVGLMVAQLQGDGAGRSPSHSAPWRQRGVAVLQFVLSPKMLLRLMLVVLVIALVMTHSRMGNGAFFLALLVTGGAVAWASQRLRKPALWLVASMLVIDLIVIGQWVGLERVVERVAGTAVTQAAQQADSLEPVREYREETLEARMYAPAAAWQLALDAPWLGHGGGSFFAAFPAFKDARVYPQYFEHAHNDYTEVAADVGLPGLALWVGLGLSSWLLALRLLADGQGATRRGAGVAATLAGLALGLHSLVDFNLHIPANALTLACLLALAWATWVAAADTPPRRRRNRPRPNPDSEFSLPASA